MTPPVRARQDRFEVGQFTIRRVVTGQTVRLEVEDRVPDADADDGDDCDVVRVVLDVGSEARCETSGLRENRSRWPLWNGLPAAGWNRCDPFLQTSWWMYWRQRQRFGTRSSEVRRTMREAYAVLRDTAVFAAGLCDPSARRLALRFNPHARWWIYRALVRDPKGYLAQAWHAHPGVALFAYALEEIGERLPSPHAATRLVDGLECGRRLRHLVDEAVEAWSAIASTECGRGDDLDAPWMRMEQASAAERSRILAEQRLLVLRAGPRVPTAKMWLPPPLGFVPEDVPRRVRANAAWFKVAKSVPIALGPIEGVGLAKGTRFARFLSRNAVALDALARRQQRRASFFVGDLVDYCRAEDHFPDRDAELERVLDASAHWHLLFRWVPMPEPGPNDQLAGSGIREASIDRPLAPLPCTWEGLPQAHGKGALKIEPITTLGDLLDEGRHMHHCVASRAFLAIDGKAWFFSAQHHGERLTVEVRRARGGWRVSEMRRFANGTPTWAEHAAVDAWLTSVSAPSASDTSP